MSFGPRHCVSTTERDSLLSLVTCRGVIEWSACANDAPPQRTVPDSPLNFDKTQSGRARGSARKGPVASIFLKTIARRLCRGAAARCGHVFDAAHQSISSVASGLNNEQTSATCLLYSRFVSALLFILHGGARWWAWSGPAPAHRLGSRGEPRAKLNANTISRMTPRSPLRPGSITASLYD